MAHLFNNVNEVREFVPVNLSFTYENLLPYVTEAEEEVLIPYISEDLLTTVKGYITAGTPVDETSSKLLKLVRTVAINFALFQYIPFAEVNIGDDGITTVSTGSSSTRTTAHSGQIHRLLNSLEQRGWNALDRLLHFLEKNIATYSEFAASEEYDRFQRGLIRSTQMFNDIYNIGNSRLTFQALHPALLNVEEDTLIPLITRAHYNAIKSGTTSDEKYEKLLRVARKYIVFQAVANVIQLNQNVNLSNNTLRIHASNRSSTNQQSYYEKPSNADRRDAQAAAQQQADAYLDLINETLSDIEGQPDTSTLGGIIGDKIVMF